MENFTKINPDVNQENIKEQIETVPIGVAHGRRYSFVVFLILKDKECYLIGNSGLGAWHEDLSELTSRDDSEEYSRLLASIDKMVKQKQLEKPFILGSEICDGDYVIEKFSETFLEELRGEAEKYLKKKGLWEENVREQDRRNSLKAQGFNAL